MGQHADDILDGVTCACGAFLDGEAPGHPRYCDKQCAKDYAPENKPNKVRCPQCKRSVKPAGLKDHIRMMHTTHPADASSLEKLKEKFS